jgi:hypothetical protein
MDLLSLSRRLPSRRAPRWVATINGLRSALRWSPSAGELVRRWQYATGTLGVAGSTLGGVEPAPGIEPDTFPRHTEAGS